MVPSLRAYFWPEQFKAHRGAWNFSNSKVNLFSPILKMIKNTMKENTKFCIKITRGNLKIFPYHLVVVFSHDYWEFANSTIYMEMQKQYENISNVFYFIAQLMNFIWNCIQCSPIRDCRGVINYLFHSLLL